MSFASMHNDYLDPDKHLWEEEPPCEKCKHDTGSDCALTTCNYEEKKMSSPANAIEVLEDVLDSTGYELDEEQREVVAETLDILKLWNAIPEAEREELVIAFSQGFSEQVKGNAPKESIKKCPRCRDDLEYAHKEATFAYPECTIPYCLTCGWEGDPE